VYKLEVYARVRRAVQVEGISQREAARQFGLSRQTVKRMLAYSIPPGYERKKPVAKPKLGPWLGFIDQILADDPQQPKKQRHTTKRIWERLKSEHWFPFITIHQNRQRPFDMAGPWHGVPRLVENLRAWVPIVDRQGDVGLKRKVCKGLARFEQGRFYAARVRNASMMGSQFPKL